MVLSLRGYTYARIHDNFSKNKIDHIHHHALKVSSKKHFLLHFFIFTSFEVLDGMSEDSHETIHLQNVNICRDFYSNPANIVEIFDSETSPNM